MYEIFLAITLFCDTQVHKNECAERIIHCAQVDGIIRNEMVWSCIKLERRRPYEQ